MRVLPISGFSASVTVYGVLMNFGAKSLNGRMSTVPVAIAMLPLLSLQTRVKINLDFVSASIAPKAVSTPVLL